MNRHLVILTGASRGLGHAMAQQLLAQADTELLAISRHTSPDLAPTAQGGRLEQWALDLSSTEEAAARLEAWLRERDPHAYARASLVNNAALVTPPGPVDDTDTGSLVASLRVGLEAPVLLTAAFLRATRGWGGRRRVLNISSGLGRRAMAATAPYCAVKAGLDNFSRAVALDEAQHPTGARVVSLAPGVIDTDMQVQLRTADARKFPDRAAFVGLHEQGQLASPAAAAAKVLAYLERDDFGRNVLADVRDA
jgi:NAD(P)-dependent dehydrogenase (short-subunit alcohol dehydrogenase family)